MRSGVQRKRNEGECLGVGHLFCTGYQFRLVWDPALASVINPLPGASTAAVLPTVAERKGHLKKVLLSHQWYGLLPLAQTVT